VTAAPLTGQTAVVTGASRGIGRAVADELQRAGAGVVRLSRTQRGAGALACDVTDPDAVQRAAERVLKDSGAPDVLVNAAGTFLLKPLVDTTPGEFAEQLASNLTGPFAIVRAFLGAMLKKGRGVIVTIGSVADHQALPGNAAYGAAKHGVRGLHGVLTRELEGSGVRATLISPGPVDTAMWDAIDPDAREGFTKRADMMKPQDVAEAVVWVVTRPRHVVVKELVLEPVR